MKFDDFEHNNKWTLVFKNLEIYYPDIYSNMQSWYTSGDWEVSIRLKDGTRWIFDGRDNLISRIPDDEDISQEDYADNFARRLYCKLRDAGIGTEEFAERIGVSRHTVSRYLHGHTLPNSYMLVKICRVLQCHVNDLLDIWKRR